MISEVTHFLKWWSEKFPGADLPVSLWYTDEPGETLPPPEDHRCVISDIAKALRGVDVRLSSSSLGCTGGRRYTGFSRDLMQGFEYFLSCGLEGRVEGERYKKTPELVREHLEKSPVFDAPAPVLVVKRLDRLANGDTPEVVVFFSPPDVLSGLFTLANFDEGDPFGVITPFAAGCGTVVLFPYLENRAERPRCVLGMFDVSARPYVSHNVLTFAVPFRKFLRMAANLEESFLITPSWEKVQKRIDRYRPARPETTEV
ncbi:MAG TPA: DUF169 domain-containing protein [Thermoanaerobaculia bacterium]|nr:DUF169 domain-containing protein [Thermoanaerobaculia bacterium]HUM30401.1 DUF169 domain-containing protein [Thermoanaerobaculia bacterium]HXK68588.1 DUF169 domain-containing protein [Thermoanaerobaculia bacterium]